MTREVVDTNVILVANRQHADVSEACIAACALRLQRLMKRNRLVLDDEYLILAEYQNKTSHRTGNGPGDAFVKWALRNNTNTSRVECVALKRHPTRCFETFPDERELENFDPPDRKFVAVSAAHPSRPSILQAVDSKWLMWREALLRHSVTVDFVCPEDIQRFHENKVGA